MCGFAGIWWGDGEPPRGAHDIAARMLGAIEHRGPDAASWIDSPHGRIGFRRLSIMDPESGHQPVSTGDGRIQAFLNGEIYNHRELRRPIESGGTRLPSGSDAEIIPHLYRRHGDEFVARLDGMFAICVVDHARGRLTLVRDQFGIKPMFHALVDGCLVFASEMKAIIASGLVPTEIDRASLVATLDLLHVPGHWTMLDRVLKLPPGGRLVADRDPRRLPAPVRPHIDRWHQTTIRPQVGRADTGPDRLRELLDDAVRQQLVADVPVGIALSGGIDSTLIAESAARVRKAGDPPIIAFTCDAPGAPPDELPLARATAARLGLDHRVVRGDTRSIDERLPELAWMADEPIADPALISGAWLSEAAAATVTVLLLGAGGDELFAGYRGTPVRTVERLWSRVPATVRKTIVDRLAGGDPHRAARLEAMGRSRRSRLAMHLLLRSQLPPDVRAGIGAALMPGPGVDRDPAAAIREAFTAAIEGDLITQQLHADLTTYLPDQLLAMFDRTTMAASIEGRLPMLDRRFAAAAMAIPGSAKIGRGNIGKRHLRDMLSPHSARQLRCRPKHGFASPIAGWMRTRMPEVLGRLATDPRSISRTVLRPGWVDQRIASAGTLDWRHAGWMYALTLVETWNRVLLTDRRTTRPTEDIDSLLSSGRSWVEPKRPSIGASTIATAPRTQHRPSIGGAA
jgi:asparagine synthase (glutamine-hydrolysing)